MKLNDVLSFITKNNLAVIATVDSKGNPEAAVVEFGELKDLTIIIDTLKSSRKYKNLKNNPRVAMVIGWDDDISVQIEGIVIELAGEELIEFQKAYFAKNPKAKKWADSPAIATWQLNQSGYAIQTLAVSLG